MLIKKGVSVEEQYYASIFESFKSFDVEKKQTFSFRRKSESLLWRWQAAAASRGLRS